MDERMKREVLNMAKSFIDRYNAVVGAAVTIMTAVFGIYWYVFAGYLLCNVLD